MEEGEGGPLNSVPCMVFSQEQGTPLLREILIEAWSIARMMPNVTGLVFGMVPPVSAIIANLSVAEIEQVVVRYLPYLRPRWEHRGMFWRRLLEAAIGPDDGAITDVHRYSLQLLGGDLAQRQSHH